MNKGFWKYGKVVIASELENQEGFTKEIFMLCFGMKSKT